MTDNKVQIEVEVITKGQESLKQVNTDLKKVSDTTKDFSDAGLKQTNSLNLMNTSLVKMIPNLQSAVPFFQALNFGSLLTGAAIAGVGLESLKLAQSLQDLMVSYVMLGVITGVTAAGGMTDFVTTMGEIQRLSDLFGVSTGQVADGMTKLQNVTHDTSISEALFADALKLSHDANIPLKDAIDQVIAAYLGQSVILDSSGQKQLKGMDAVNALTDAYNEQKTGIASFTSETGMAFGKYAEDWLKALGTIGKGLLLFGEMLFIGLTQWLEWFGKFGIDVSTDIWHAIQGIWNVFMDLIHFLVDVFTGQWGKAWDAIKNLARDACQVIVNLTINPLISALNALISLINLIPGVNIGKIGKIEIPKFAEGGIVTSPTLALLGEKGPEKITPLNGSDESGGAGGPSVINLYMPDGTLVGQWYSNQLENQVRLKGAY